MKNIGALVLILLICAAFAGCASLSVNAKVNPDASISNYKVTIETTSTVYGMMGGQLRGKFDPKLMDYNEQWNGDKVTITVTAKSALQSNDPKNWTIKKENGRMVYFDNRLTSISEVDKGNQYTAAMLKTVSLHYYLEMPGKIVSSNANTVEDNTAEWHLQGENLSTPIRAESEVPNSIPGFEALPALIGIFGVILVMYIRR